MQCNVLQLLHVVVIVCYSIPHNIMLYIQSNEQDNTTTYNSHNQHTRTPDVYKHVQRIRSISEISSCFFGPRPWRIEIRHRVKKSTINLFGFETLKS